MLIETNSIRFADGSVSTCRELSEAAESRFASLEDGLRSGRTLFVADNARDALQALIFSHNRRLDTGVITPDRLNLDMRTALFRAGMSLFDCATGKQDQAVLRMPPVESRITVFTSGTTGAPKLIEHNWTTMNTLARAKNFPPRTWFAPYQIGSYAWYQMVCLGLFQPGQNLACADLEDLAGSFAAAASEIDAISSTPTFWRMIFMSLSPDVLRAAKLQTISLGGEIVDQTILDKLAELYPQAAMRHIYASSEAGAAIVVSDGRAGFPAALLNDGNGPVGLRIADGRLFVRSSFTHRAADGASGEWLDTGDIVEIESDRVHFRGRASEKFINVGGMKAYPAQIEGQLLRHPDVRWAKVSARRAPMVGSLPFARVVVERGERTVPEVEAELARFLRGSLPSYAIPRIWELLDNVPIKKSLKA